MRPRRPGRRGATAARIALGLVAASTLFGAGPARAQDGGPVAPPTLGGFSGSAAASGLHVTYAPEGLLPTGPPLDLGAPDALATIASGPSTFARASVADPGDLLANPGALLALASPDYPPGLIPPYPFRIAAGSGVGAPSVESAPAPGLHARVTAEGGASSAEATAPGISAPGVATIGSMSAVATTETDGSTITVHARSQIGGINILGLVRIESILTDVTATSQGGETTLEGGTTVVGASLLGQEVVIDDEGIRTAAGGLDLGSLLSAVGIRLTLPGPVELAGGGTGQLASTGLRLDIEVSPQTFPALDDLLDSLPPIPPLAPGAPSIEDVLAAARARHLVSIEIGRGVVSLTARGTTPRATTPSVTTPPARPSTGGPAPAAARPVTPAPRPSSAGPAAPAAPGPVLASDTPDLTVGTGIGAIAVMLMLIQPIIGDRLARVAAAQLATDREGCQWERPWERP